MGFVRLVKRLFTFIEAVRSRDWNLYLSSFEAMIKDFQAVKRQTFLEQPLEETTVENKRIKRSRIEVE